MVASSPKVAFTFHADGIMKIHKYLSVEMATSVKTDAHTDIIEMKLHTLQ